MNFKSMTQEIRKDNPFIIVTPKNGGEGKPLIVILHGYGKSADEYSSLPSRISETDFNYVIPQGPHRFWDKDKIGYAWVMTLRGGEDKQGRLMSEKVINMATEEALKITKSDPNRVIIMAFSQAAFVATSLGLRHSHVYQRVILQGGWANLAFVEKQIKNGIENIDFFIQHGTCF